MVRTRREGGGMKKGDKIQAKWAGSTFYFPAIMLEQIGTNCKVQFEDGSVATLRLADVKPLSPKTTREPASARTQNRSRSRSVGRPRRSRSRSPSRKSSSKDKKDSKQKSASSKSKANHSDTAISSEDKVRQRNTDTSSTKVSSIFVNSSTEKVVYSEVTESKKEQDTDVVKTRASARIAALQAGKVVAAKTSKKSSDESEEDEEEEEVTKRRPKRSEFDAMDNLTFSIYSFLMVLVKMSLIISFPLFFFTTCSNKKACHLLEISPLYTNSKTFLVDIKQALPVVSALYIFLTIVSKIPLGPLVPEFSVGMKKRVPERKYRVNGFYQLLLCLGVFGGISYYGMDVGLGFRRSRAIIISTLIHSFFWSVLMYMYGKFRKDPFGSTPIHRAKFLGNFYYGQDTNQWFFGIEDLKTRFLHFGLIGLVLWDLSIMSKPFLATGTVPIPLILTTSMHMLFVLVFLWREENVLSTATYTEDGIGFSYLTGIGCTIPSLFALQTLYVLNYKDKTILPHWCSAGIAVLFLIGLYLHDSSMTLKHRFRKCAFSPALSHVQSIPTSLKKRLITSGIWGKIRHPNYLGLLVMVVACSLPCGFTHAVPHLPVLYLFLLLTLRMLRLESTCSMAYGPAWQNYGEIAKYRIIPYVC